MDAQRVDTSNYVYLCMTPHFWGWDERRWKAIANCIASGGRKMIRDYGYVIYHVHPDFEIMGTHGEIYTPVGHPLITVEDKIKKADRR